ncbi:MAG: phosphatidate cytidylyltransferase [Anaerolineae bacterium]|jgi:phosphatidate cytidylyltransferase
MFLQRAIITLIAGPLVLYLIFLGGWFYFVPVTVILLLAAQEYISIFRRYNWHLSQWVVILSVFSLLVVGQWFDIQLLSLVLLLASLSSMTYALYLYEKGKSKTAPGDWMAMAGGILLIGWGGAHFFMLRRVEQMPWQWTMLAMLSTWIADSGAYLVGKFLTNRILGRHKLAPLLSPNKTVEGYVGGIVLGLAFTIIIGIYLQLPLNLVIILGFFASAVSPLGDLGISMLKRSVGIKDSGTLFPGHGGALDRIDSLIWSVMAAYYLVVFMA